MSELVVLGRERTPAEIADGERPTYVLPGGGSRIRFTATGREVTISGESLRHALRRRRIRKAIIPGDPIHNGGELVVDISVLEGWLNRGATDLGPEAVVVGKEAVPTTRGKSVPEQQDQALRESGGEITMGSVIPALYVNVTSK
jgi:hypothetical protein